jgi:hypothetical protein
MKQKYERPYSKNLGEMLPNAEGYCVTNGNSANVAFPQPNCLPGTNARGAVCADGGYPSSQACNPGTNPVNFGCLPGLGASVACTSGSGVS